MYSRNLFVLAFVRKTPRVHTNPKEAVMTQTRYTLQQHHINLKSSVKLSHVNMYHCESPASNIFPGHPYSKIIFIQKGDGQFYFGNQFLPVQENDLLSKLFQPCYQYFLANSVLIMTHCMLMPLLPQKYCSRNRYKAVFFRSNKYEGNAPFHVQG